MKNLCFAGGGMKGIAYLGVYKYLLENDMLKDLENLSGTSIGSIICLVILLKYTFEEVNILVENLNASLIEDIDIRNLISGYSINAGKKILYFLEKILTSKGYSNDITFIQLYNKTKIGLHVCSTCLNNYSRTIFNHINTPNLSVVKACKYSINIPFVWTSDKLFHQHFVDGCLSTNLPIEDFPKENTLGFYCKTEKTSTDIENIKDYTLKIIKCILHRANMLEIKEYINFGYKIIIIDMYNIHSLDFNMSIEKKRELVRSGYVQFKEKYTVSS